MANFTIPSPVFVNGATIVAAEHNANWTAAQNYFDALSTGANINANAITTARIIDGAITTAKLATSLALTTPDIGAATGTSLSVTGTVVSHIATNAQVASYTLVLADDGKVVEMGVGSANTLTVPPNASVAFPIGTQIVILQTGAGQTTLTQGAGVTINATPGSKLRTTWSSATLIKRATDTWVAIGDLSA
jgi:hypothetical protein